MDRNPVAAELPPIVRVQAAAACAESALEVVNELKAAAGRSEAGRKLAVAATNLEQAALWLRHVKEGEL